MSSETLLLGTEIDDQLRDALTQVLVALGAERRAADWVLAGSHVIETWDFQISGDSVRIEAETYMGRSITGPVGLVHRVRELVVEALHSPPLADG